MPVWCACGTRCSTAPTGHDRDHRLALVLDRRAPPLGSRPATGRVHLIRTAQRHGPDPYDYPGDPELAKLAALGEELGTPTHASEDDHLPVYYATINLLHYLRDDENVVSVSVVQTGETDDFMTMGEAVGEAIARLDRRAVVLASRRMSHAFWPLEADLEARGLGSGPHHHTPRPGRPTRRGWSG